MLLSKLSLTGFKNYPEANFSFKKGVNCIVGNNGVGKTNLLDAIHFLALAKTAFPVSDAQVICANHDFYTVVGLFKDKSRVAIQYDRRSGKTLKVDGNEEKKLSRHVGKIPIVLITPDDTDIVKNGSEVRRKFFDSAICQIDSSYLESLMQYQSILRQRNQLLKQAESPRQVNHRLLDTYDDQLLPLAQKISNRRFDFLQEFQDQFGQVYHELHSTSEIPKIEMHTKVLEDDFPAQFKKARTSDLLMQRTTVGSHRDQYEFILDGEPLKKFGSQGQQKTFILALKLTEFQILKDYSGKTPLLLLDDIFDKLDDSRIQLLTRMLYTKQRFGQIFITDARKERSEAFFENREVNFVELS